MSTLSSVTDGQLCDDAGVPGCAPKVVVQTNDPQVVTVSQPTTVNTQSGDAKVVTPQQNAKVVVIGSQSPQVTTNSQTQRVVTTGQQGPQGPAGSDANVDAHEAADDPHPQYLLIADVGPSLPAGGTTGQALRKLSATDGDAAWSSHWVVDPTTGAMSSTLPDDATPITINVTPIPLMLSVESKLTDANVDDGPGIDRKAVLKISKAGSFSLTTNSDYYSILPSTQIGYNNLQIGSSNIQSGYGNTQSGAGNTQSGGGNTQSGYSNTQSGASNTQSGYGNTQSGYYNTQSGNYGTQSGKFLNNGGFDHTFMVGNTKTATVGDRAYFALDNGIWIKPVAAAPASPENGVIYYDSTTHKFRGYANGAWVDLH